MNNKKLTRKITSFLVLRDVCMYLICAYRKYNIIKARKKYGVTQDKERAANAVYKTPIKFTAWHKKNSMSKKI